eukprot:TRINITY_DN536_c0_g1_i1.p1 TRINITY_DN536_c0_g1~~TRINITY_DN536_c0_g1_i1.p1  ORF type:complete len:126 (-),score=12.98 TRINITY_DN536_c0_g1_i1:93-470(-)
MEGCGAVVPKASLETHMQEMHSLVPCSCGKTVEKSKISRHKERSCKDRLRSCRFCEMKIAAREYRAHLEYCGSRTTVCPRCKQRVRLNLFRKHYESQCGKSHNSPRSGAESASIFEKMSDFFSFS